MQILLCKWLNVNFYILVEFQCELKNTGENAKEKKNSYDYDYEVLYLRVCGFILVIKGLKFFFFFNT